MLALKTSKQTVTRLAFSPDGARLAVAGTGKKVHLWDLTAKKLKATVLPTFKDPVEWVGFLPNGHLLALSTMGQYAVHDPIADTTDEAALPRRWVGTIVATPDCTAFYGTGWEARKWAFDGRLRQEWVQKISGNLLAGRGGAVLTPDGDFVAAVSNGDDKTWLHTRDAATGTIRSEHLAARSIIRDLTLLADGRTFAFVRGYHYKDLTANAVLVGTPGEKFLTIRKAITNPYSALALHPSGPRLAVGQFDGTVATLETSSWAEVSAHKWPVEGVASIAFAPDGLKAAVGGAKGQVVVWDVDV